MKKIYSLRWSTLRNIGRLSMMKTSYFWIAFVPVVAKAFSNVNQLEMPGFNGKFILQLSLPFSWQIFFYSSLFFAFAQTIYLFVCPEILRKYADFKEYLEHSGGQEELKIAFMKITSKMKVKNDMALKDFVRKYDTLGFSDAEIKINNAKNVGEMDLASKDSLLFSPSNWYKYVLYEMQIDNERIKDVFYHVSQVLEYWGRLWQWVALIFYIIGFGLLSVVVLQNFLFVWKLTF